MGIANLAAMSSRRYPFRPRPRRKKMKPQSSFQGACRYFLQGILCRYFSEAFSLSIRLRGRRFASCRVRKKVKRSAHNPYSGLFGNPRQTRVSNLAIAPNMQLRTFGKILNPAFQIDRPQTPIFSFLSPFKTVYAFFIYSHRLYGHQRANCEKSRNGAAL